MNNQGFGNDIFENAKNLVNGQVGINLFFLMKSDIDSEMILKHANIADDGKEGDENTSTSLLLAYQKLINSRFSKLSNDSVIDLSCADDRLDAVYKYDLTDIPLQFAAMKIALELADADEKNAFNFLKDDLSNIQGLIIVIGDAERKLVLYKQNYPISLLKRDNFMMVPVPHSTRFVRLDKDILRIDINFQYSLFEDNIYIFDLNKLESLIGYDGIIKKEAEKSIEAIKEMGLLEDVQPLRDDIDDITFSRKLTKVYKDSKVIGKVENRLIVLFVKQHAYFRNHPIKVNHSGDKLVIDTKVSKNALIKLLNDDLLYSELTKSEYESVAKNNIE